MNATIAVTPRVHVAVAALRNGRDEHAGARSLLRRLLADVAPAAAGAPLAARERGQPYLLGQPGVGISLSHSGGLAAAAVHLGGPIGVDVQEPYPAGERLVRRCCPDHADALLRLGRADRDLELAWIWTVQEACVKATGDGLAARPWTIPVRPGARRGAWRHLTWRTLRGRHPTPLSCAYSTKYGRDS